VDDMRLLSTQGCHLKRRELHEHVMMGCEVNPHSSTRNYNSSSGGGVMVFLPNGWNNTTGAPGGGGMSKQQAAVAVQAMNFLQHSLGLQQQHPAAASSIFFFG